MSLIVIRAVICRKTLSTQLSRKFVNVPCVTIVRWIECISSFSNLFIFICEFSSVIMCIRSGGFFCDAVENLIKVHFVIISLNELLPGYTVKPV